MGLMCHVVAGYPSMTECEQLILGMDKLGVGKIEVQIPFSDPIADGETIMRANDAALAQKVDTQASFDLISRVKSQNIKAEIYVMSYLQKLISFGIEKFCIQTSKAGVRGLIVPDLPYDSPDYELVIQAAKANSLQIVPVVSPGTSDARLQSILESPGDLVYLTSTKGITGNKLAVSAELGEIANKIKKLKPDTKLAIGFGVQTRADVVEIRQIADLAVVGSSVIREIDKADVNRGLKFIEDLAVE